MSPESEPLPYTDDHRFGSERLRFEPRDANRFDDSPCGFRPIILASRRSEPFVWLKKGVEE